MNHANHKRLTIGCGPYVTNMQMKKGQRVVIERIIFDEEGHVKAVDLHDEKFGEAIFFGEGHSHYHGKLGYEYE